MCFFNGRGAVIEITVQSGERVLHGRVSVIEMTVERRKKEREYKVERLYFRYKVERRYFMGEVLKYKSLIQSRMIVRWPVMETTVQRREKERDSVLNGIGSFTERERE